MEDYGVPRSMIQLADSNEYDDLPDFNGLVAVEGTAPNVAPSWQSPFLGKSLTEISAWVGGYRNLLKRCVRRSLLFWTRNYTNSAEWFSSVKPTTKRSHRHFPGLLRGLLGGLWLITVIIGRMIGRIRRGDDDNDDYVET